MLWVQIQLSDTLCAECSDRRTKEKSDVFKYCS